ncbi:MAG: PDZ domain-containing protein [Myxococcales bacterium]|nr:PDZ domain-containing protein [Myxococcales bacterium]
MRQEGRTVVALTLGCALALGCAGASGGQPMGGIHAKLAYSESGGLRVIDVPPGGSADLSGIQADDIIIAINGTSIRELDYQAIVEQLRGPVGSTVQLDLFRKGEVRTVVVMRQAYTR